jgi:hypothetical protein
MKTAVFQKRGMVAPASSKWGTSDCSKNEKVRLEALRVSKGRHACHGEINSLPCLSGLWSGYLTQ